jgi:hypothetical protein
MVIRSYTHDADGRMTKVTDEMTDVTSVIHDDPYLSKAAQSVGKTQRVQKEMDDLVQKFRIGNTNPGLGNKGLDGTDVQYLRGRAGGRVFFP